MKNIFSGKGSDVEFSGDLVNIFITSRTSTWKEAKVNGKHLDIKKFNSVFKKSEAETELKLANENEYTNVKIEVVTVEDKKTEVNFKIKRKAGKVNFNNMYTGFYISGSSDILDKEVTAEHLYSGKTLPHKTGNKALIEIRSYKHDFMEKITIDGSVCEIKTDKTEKGTIYYYGRHTVTDIKPSKEISIQVEPKDKNVYEPINWKIKLEYSEKSGNAGFVNDGTFGFSPKIEHSLKYKYGEQYKAHNEYGLLSDTIKAYTQDPDATVFYQLVMPNGEVYGDEEQKEMQNNSGEHTATINCFENKPMYVKLWVVSSGGNTDDEKGKEVIKYNPVRLRWDYLNDKKIGEEFVNEGYDVIEFDKTKVKNNKLYLAFGAWDGEAIEIIKVPYTVDTKNALSQYQSVFTKLQKKVDEDGLPEEEQVVWYKTEIDVSSLTSSEKSIDVILPISNGEKEVFTYKVKVKIK